MPTLPVVQTRRSYVANRPPLPADIAEGQLAFNGTMFSLYTKDLNGNIIQIGVKPGDLAPVATSGNYNDLINKPTSTGALQYQGPWNASTNTPTIPTASAGNKLQYFVVAVAGTTNIDGNTTWAVGDQLISNGTTWDRIPLSQPQDTTSNVAVNITNSFLDPVNYIFTRQSTYSLNFATSAASFVLTSGTAATINIQKNGTVVGTISLTGSTTVAFTSVSSTTTIFSPGDILTYVATTSNIGSVAINLTGKWALS